MRSPLSPRARFRRALALALIVVVVTYGMLRLLEIDISTPATIVDLLLVFLLFLAFTIFVRVPKPFRTVTKYRIHFAEKATGHEVDQLYREIEKPPPGYSVFRSHRRTLSDGHWAIDIEIFNTESERAQVHRLAGYSKRPGVSKVETLSK